MKNTLKKTIYFYFFPVALTVGTIHKNSVRTLITTYSYARVYYNFFTLMNKVVN